MYVRYVGNGRANLGHRELGPKFPSCPISWWPKFTVAQRVVAQVPKVLSHIFPNILLFEKKVFFLHFGAQRLLWPHL